MGEEYEEKKGHPLLKWFGIGLLIAIVVYVGWAVSIWYKYPGDGSSDKFPWFEAWHWKKWETDHKTRTPKPKSPKPQYGSSSSLSTFLPYIIGVVVVGGGIALYFSRKPATPAQG